MKVTQTAVWPSQKPIKRLKLRSEVWSCS